jgi:PKHD-type hydroxylase
MIAMTGVEPFTFWNGAFTDKELDTIVEYGDSLKPADATILSEVDRPEHNSIRVTQISWIEQLPETLWLYEKLAGLTWSINEQSYRFEIAALEKPQYTVYRAGERGHYDWHVDHGPTGRRRKLSFVLQLSPPADYEECELQIYGSSKIDTAPKDRGTLMAFPSYVLHRVTPITRGIRRSLVIWCSGPVFK